MTRIDINADMGEGFGRWTLGDDAALMPHITSANIACGFHAGDPHIMRHCVQLAVENDVGIGAHVGFQDLSGFGRRRIDIAPALLKDHVLFQIGALSAFAAAEGRRVEHVKAHSALYRLCIEDFDYADAIAGAAAAFDRSLILISTGPIAAAAAHRHGLRFANEGLIDLEFDETGSYVPEWPKMSWDPANVAVRAADVAIAKVLTWRNGTRAPIDAQTVCIHGDADNAAAVAETVRAHLLGKGVEVCRLRAVLEGAELGAV
jgi:UPF0271 protein